MTLTIGTDGAGLRLDVRLKPEIRAASNREMPPDYAPATIAAPRQHRRIHRHRERFEGQRGFSPATRAARSWESTSPVGCSAESDGCRVKPGIPSRTVGTSNIASGSLRHHCGERGQQSERHKLIRACAPRLPLLTALLEPRRDHLVSHHGGRTMPELRDGTVPGGENG